MKSSWSPWARQLATDSEIEAVRVLAPVGAFITVLAPNPRRRWFVVRAGNGGRGLSADPVAAAVDAWWGKPNEEEAPANDPMT